VGSTVVRISNTSTFWRKNKRNSNLVRALLGRSNMGTNGPTNGPTDQPTDAYKQPQILAKATHLSVRVSIGTGHAVRNFPCQTLKIRNVSLVVMGL
jgi:hypothetical protein